MFVRNGAISMAIIVLPQGDNLLSHVCLLLLKLLAFPALTSHQLTCFLVFASGYMFYHIWNWLHILQRLQLVVCFTTFAVVYMFPRGFKTTLFAPKICKCVLANRVPAGKNLHIKSLQLVACFPALATGYMFSHVCNWLYVFPCLQLVACFPLLATGCMFSLACNWLYVFPRLQLVAYFTALATGCMFSLACN